MSNRIFVMYANTHLKGEFRWLDLDTMNLYHGPFGRAPVGQGYRGTASDLSKRRWVNRRGSIVEEIVPGEQEKKGEPENSGGSVDYYKCPVKNPTTDGVEPYTAECNDIIEALDMTYAEANVFKAIWRSCAERTLGLAKAGNDAIRDAEKMVFFSDRVLKQREIRNG